MISLNRILPDPIVASSADPDQMVSGLAFDSRLVEPGSIFFAIPGAQSDGATFIPEALRRGAAVVVSERPVQDLPCQAIQVRNTRQALSQMARRFYQDPSAGLNLIGITGTKGKTTTTYLLQAILKAHFAQAFRFGTVDYDLGHEQRPAKNTTPESLILVSILDEVRRKGIRAGVMEVSSHALKSWRVEDLTFAAAGFSNLSLEHTEFHPDMEDYYLAKRRLFLELLPPDRFCVINLDDAYGTRLAGECRQAGRKTLTLGLHNHDSDLSAWIQNETLAGTQFQLKIGSAAITIELNLVGRFNVANALMAAGLATALEIPPLTIKEGLELIRNVPGRFESIPNSRNFLVIVDYAHSPAALENVLTAARQLSQGRLITVFGCGGNRSREKRPIMGRLAASLSDITVVTSDNPRKEDPDSIIREILTGIREVSLPARGEIHIEADRRKAIQTSLALAAPGDVIIIAGKGHESGQTFADHTNPFDDRDVSRELLKEMGYA